MTKNLNGHASGKNSSSEPVKASPPIAIKRIDDAGTEIENDERDREGPRWDHGRTSRVSDAEN